MLKHWMAIIMLCCIGVDVEASPNVLGVVYPIIEEDLLAVIQRRLAGSDLMQKMQNMVSTKLSSHLQSLPDRSHLVRQNDLDVHTVIPMLHVPSVNNMPAYDIQLLSVIHDFRPVLMFDARDPIQVDWLVQSLAALPSATVIATGGNVMKAIKVTQHLIAYDDTGAWAKRFELHALPAKVTYHGGLALTISEGMGYAA